MNSALQRSVKRKVRTNSEIVYMHKKQKSFRKIYRRATTTQEHRKISLEVKIEYRHIKEKGKENHPEEEQFLSKTLLGSHNQL